MSYFHTGTRTIIGAEAFHCPVRDGKEWDHLAMVIRLNGVAARRLGFGRAANSQSRLVEHGPRMRSGAGPGSEVGGGFGCDRLRHADRSNPGGQFSMASSFEERFNVFISVLDCRQSDWAAWRPGAPRGAAPSVHVRVKVIGSSLTSN